MLLLGVSALTGWSVTQRWLTAQPVPGDFELVAMFSGIAVFLCLAYGAVTRADIVVDSLTGWLPARLRRAIDAFWTAVWAAAAAIIAWRLGVGSKQTLADGTTTMVLGFSTWWAVGAGALGFAVLAAAALRGSVRLLRGGDGR